MHDHFVSSADAEALRTFLDAWNSGENAIRGAFLTYVDMLGGMKDVRCSFKARPGISYSLRAHHAAQRKRPFFAMVDVVDDDPENRWLSVCFYDDMVTDTEELGDFAPEGLSGEDARCFNLEDDSRDMADYIGHRLEEAAQRAGADA